MNKYLVAVLICFGLASCRMNDTHYYELHPVELQAAVKACPGTAPQGVTCEELQLLARRMNGLAYQLQANPQDFGKKILTLQQTIADQENQLKKEGISPKLQASIVQMKQDLAEYLAIVKWLESPTS